MGFTGYAHGADEASLRHVIKGHVGNNEDDPRLVALTISDLPKIGDVVAAPDAVMLAKRRNNMDVIMYQKRIGNLYIVVEEVRVGRKRLALKTAYAKK